VFQQAESRGLGARMVRGGAWVLALRIAQRALSFIRLLVLVHWLAPNDFGLMGAAMLAYSMLNSLTGVGLQSAMIQRKEIDRSLLDIAWTFQIVRGAILALVLFACAPLAARLVNATEITAIIRVLALTFVIQACTSSAIVYLRKELAFDKHFFYQFGETVAEFSVTLTTAFLLRSVWALVLGRLVSCAVACVLSYVIVPYRPRINFAWRQAEGIWNFGLWVLGSAILIFLLTQSDQLAVAGLLGTTMLGYYRIAFRVSNAPTTEFSQILSHVTFPAFSKLQESTSQFRQAYLRVFRLTAFAVFPLSSMILVLAAEFTTLFLGNAWTPAIPLIQCLAVYGLMESLGATTRSVFMASGRLGTMVKLQVLQVMVLALSLVPLTVCCGALGAAFAMTASTTLFSIILLTKAWGLLGISIFHGLREMVTPLLSACLSTGAVLCLPLGTLEEGYVGFFTRAIVAGLLYLGASYAFDRILHTESWRLIAEVWGSLVKKSIS